MNIIAHFEHVTKKKASNELVTFSPSFYLCIYLFYKVTIETSKHVITISKCNPGYECLCHHSHT